MQYIRPLRNPEHDIPAPVRESRSLKIDDIPGAKAKPVAVTKNIVHYRERLSNDPSKYQENMQNHQFFNNHEYIFGGELKVGFHNKVLHGKRHYGDHYRSEIHETGGIKRGDPTESHLQAFDYPRNLNIADIPGTLAGSAKSRILINHDLAQKIRRGASVQRERPEEVAAPRRQVGDSLDRFQQEQISNIVRERRASRNEDNKNPSIAQDLSGLEAPKKEHQSREHASEGNIKQVFNSSKLYRNAAGHPTRKGDMSFDNISRRKMSSQDYTYSYDRSNTGMVSDRKDETPNRIDNQYEQVFSNKDNSRATTVNENITNLTRKANEPQRAAMGDSKAWKESVLEQAYGKVLNKKDDYKKVYTFNIISNQPNQKMLPSNARLPYRYAIPFDVDQLTANKRDTSHIEHQNQAEMKRAHNLLLQHNNNIGREYNQSVPVGRESYQGGNGMHSEHDYNNSMNRNPIM